MILNNPHGIYLTGIVDAHLESAPANVVDAWSEYDMSGDLQKTKDEAERVNQYSRNRTCDRKPNVDTILPFSDSILYWIVTNLCMF